MDNTTRQQDRDIEQAVRHASGTEAYVTSLVDIIAEMDLEITRWKEASGCKEPLDLELKLKELQP